MVSAVVPVFVAVTLTVLVSPVGCWLKTTVPGEALNPGFVPYPLTPNPTVPESVAKLMIPVTAPLVVGVKVTGTDSVWPVVSETGRAGACTENGAAAVMPETGTGLGAVTVSVPDAGGPTLALPRARSL